MNSILAIYDIPQSLKVTNPSAVLRRYGVRINLSAWVFPGNLVPTEVFTELSKAGATVELVEFAEQSQDKILALARKELSRHCLKLAEFVQQKCDQLRLPAPGLEDFPSDERDEKVYRKWRSVLSRARRELIAAEQCALGFAVTRDVADAMDGLKNILSVELGLATAWKAEHKGHDNSTDEVGASASDNRTWSPGVAV